jgi:beta-N-acetylhexosaminidase
VDSHIGMPSLEADRARISAMELVPFRAAIKAGVDSVMTAHMSVPAYEPEAVPATVSPNILTGLLRNELDFPGLIVTDAMDMQGLTKQFPPGEASVRALEAGADVLLMPPDPDAVIRGVLNALKEGRLTEKRITASVSRILAAKARVGLHRKKLVDVETISDVIESDELHELAQTAADRAVTLVKNEGAVVPLKTPDTACLFVLAESRYGQGGRRLIEEARTRHSATRTVLLDPLASEKEIESTMQKMTGCTVNAVAAFVSVAAYRGNVSLGGNYPALIDALLKGDAPLVLVSLGNPYLLRAFPKVQAYMATFSTAPTSESAAVKALFGEIAINGRLPVSIPGLAEEGDGISVDKR